MRCAYADPPYPGQAKRIYGKNGDPFTGTVEEVDFPALVQDLQAFDGWALSTSMTSLREVMPLCPDGVVVAAWHVTNAMPPGGAKGWFHHYSWEPVIVAPARSNHGIKNVLSCHSPMGFHVTQRGEANFPGRKPEQFSRWVFGLLGVQADDEFVDLFPGSGAVGREWERWRAQLSLLAPGAAA